MLPFSWAIEVQMDKLQRGEDGERGSLLAAFNATSLGQTVVKVFQTKEDAGIRFLYDLINFKMTIDSLSDKAMKGLCLEVYKVAKIFATENNDENVEGFEVVNAEKESPVSPVDVYKAVSHLKPRLQIIISLFNIVPELEDKLELEKLNKESHHFNLDVRALILAFDLLKPEAQKILDDKARNVWGSKITTLSTHLKQLDGLINRGKVEEECQAMLSTAWKRCHRSEIVKLFFGQIRFTV